MKYGLKIINIAIINKMKTEYNLILQQLQIDNMIENDIDYWFEMRRELEDSKQAIKCVNGLTNDNE